MWKRIVIMFGLFAAVVVGLAYYKYQNIRAGMSKPHGMPPVAVTSMIAAKQKWEKMLNAVGTFSPARGVTVAAEEGGKVVSIGFDSGNKVRQGDLLVQQDVSVEEAQLESATAKVELAKSNLKRIQDMMGTGAVSQSDLDQTGSQLKQDMADADALRATIERKTIRAPFDGITGIRQVQLGQYLSPGNPVVTLQTLDPIYLDFSLPQQQLTEVKLGQEVEAVVDTFPKEKFKGKITTISPLIDDSTRMVQLQATLENGDLRLRPGMYARVSVLLNANDDYITLPVTSLIRAPYGDSVYVIETMKKPTGQEYKGARQVFVKAGMMRGDQIAILEGIEPGQEVVTSGGFKLRPNAEVMINNQQLPGNSASPTPPDN
jgi:membrane fusion protein (multidrug efflux system)